MTQRRYYSLEQALASIADFRDGQLVRNGERVQTLKVVGSPRSGKSTVCFEAFVDEGRGRVQSADATAKTSFAGDAPSAAELVRQGRSVLIESHRARADVLSNEAVTRVGNSIVSRPVRTLAAFAFDLVAKRRAQLQLSAPKLLNGAEQDQVIREVLAEHVQHAERGDDATCATCKLLNQYFAVRTPATDESVAEPTQPETTATVFSRMMTPAFAAQLRDMFARLSEMHFGLELTELEEVTATALHTHRQAIEWKLAFALRGEYAHRLEINFPNQYRLDSSFVLVEAEKVVSEHIASKTVASEGLNLAEFMIVDDAQDLTLAGYSLLQTLAKKGVRIVLVGNDDESVQSFRGAYPEVISALELSPKGMNAHSIELEPRFAEASEVSETHKPHTIHKTNKVHNADEVAATNSTDYRAVVTSRISQAIGSVMVNDVAVPLRPGKLPAQESGTGQARDCASLSARLFHTPAEELDDLVWQIKTLKLENADNLNWADMAIIAHDNATLRTIGKRFENENIPVAYSSVTRPLKEDSTVQGLLAMLRLMNAVEPSSPVRLESAEVATINQWVTLVAQSTLFSVRDASSGTQRPLRLATLTAALSSLAVLEGIQSSEAEVGSSPFSAIRALWHERGGTEGPIGVKGLLALLVVGSSDVRTQLAELLDSVLTRHRLRRSGLRFFDPDVIGFMALVEAVHSAARKLQKAPTRTVYAALWQAWDSCGVAEEWRKLALGAGPTGRLANERLDTVIRLFEHADINDGTETVPHFIERIGNLEIEADSLAKVAPKEDSVTLATPAGSSGLNRSYVWVAQLQQDVWPNLTPRNTLFDSEALADIVLSQLLVFIEQEPQGAQRGAVLDSEQQRLSVLYAEMKSFLVAVSRASTRVTLSAVWSDDAAPSEFLFAFVSELFPPGDAHSYQDPRSGAQIPRSFTPVGMRGQSDKAVQNQLIVDHGGQDVSIRGLVAIARKTIVEFFAGSAQGGSLADGEIPKAVQDSARTLAYLAGQGVTEADPTTWAFAQPGGEGHDAPTQEAVEENTQKDELDDEEPENIALSPSSVDGIWRCPLKWSMENRFAGPRASNPATSFGTLIHACAQFAAQQSLDTTASVEELTTAMCAEYKRLRALEETPQTAEETYRVEEKNNRVEAVLRNIAQYFVDSREANYTFSEKAKTTLPPAGVLEKVEVEKPFKAHFNFSQIFERVTKTPVLNITDKAELFAVFSALAEGFSKDFSPQAVITLSGRIDRLEQRRRGEERVLNVVDYKTGHAHTSKEIFSDLQLVCYQLGLVFGSSEEANVERSVLFDVEKSPAPAVYHNEPEGAYQPAIFAAQGLNAHFQKRAYAPKVSKFFDEPDALKKPQATEIPQVLERLKKQAVGNEQLLWCLTVLSRIYYAASFRFAQTFPAKRGPQCRFCAFRRICPAWPNESATIYGEAQ